MASEFHGAQADFALRLLTTVSKSGENAFLSPASISIALGMTYAGSADDTQKQMNEVLFGGAKDSEIHEQLSELVKWMREPRDEYQLHAANRLYAQSDFSILKAFLELLSKHYLNEVHPVDFKANADAVADQISEWVAETTQDRIKDLISHGVLNQTTRLVLVNAIYFKGNWQHQFDEGATHKQIFYSSPDCETEVEMMYAKQRFLFKETSTCKVLGMHYKGDRLKLFVVLPNDRFGLEDLQEQLSGDKFLSLLKGCEYDEVEVELPKFKLEQGFDLADTLKCLGMTDLFDDTRADLSNVTGAKDLVVSAVIHKAFIEVNERGSEAAAATAIAICLTSAVIGGRRAPRFIADHPFLFSITDSTNLLFLGKFFRPQKL